MGIASEVIQDLIDDFLNSDLRKKMDYGEKYFRIGNDILSKDLSAYSIYDQKTKTTQVKHNNYKSNQKIAHSFYSKQVNQKTAYVASKPITITYNSPIIDENNENKIKEKDKIITDIVWNALGISFEKLIKNRLKEASNKAIAWIHPDYKDGKLIFRKYKSEECIPIYDNESQEFLVGFIHFYEIKDLTTKPTKKIKYVEYWDENEVSYYIETKNDDGSSSFVEDVSREKPGCHWKTRVYNVSDGTLKRIEKHSWNRVPFICVENNEEHINDLEPIKNLIDAYDLIDSNFVNTVEDLKEIVWLINGYGSEDLLALIENLKVNGVARTNDTAGKIDAKLLPIPYEARQALLKGLKELIYEFGRAVDTSNKDLVGQAPSGVSLNFLYTDLDLKAEDIIPSLKSAIYEMLWYVLQDLKRKGIITKELNEFDFRIEFNKTRIFNEVEKASALSNDTVLSTKTKLEKHPWCDDVDIELERIKQEKEENAKLQSTIFNASGGFDDTHNNDDTE